MDSRYRNRDFHAPQFGLTGRLTPPDSEQRDSLSLLHPSLGLAFTAEFKPQPEVHRSNVRAFDTMVNCLHFLRGDTAKDNLPHGCDGCRERIDGSLVCCQEISNEPR